MIKAGLSPSWEWDEGWVACDAGWETWVGSVECMAADWEAPSRSAVRNLMDGGEGPPMLREGCVVMRGLDWENAGSCGNSDADGKLKYEAEKAEREKERKQWKSKQPMIRLSLNTNLVISVMTDSQTQRLQMTTILVV
jgi:hypothetical protein